LPVKNQQYYIFKFNSSRLRKYKYNINLNFSQAVKNQELVSIGDSQLLRSLRFLKNEKHDQFYIDSLFLEKRKIKNKRSSRENIQKLIAIENELNDILFIPEIISIVVNKNRDYLHIINNGIIVNNKKYKRLLCGAGHSRRNTVLLIQEDMELPIKKLLNNGRNEEIELVPAKYNAYFALTSSATVQVSEPRGVTVIRDCEIKRTERVDYIQETDNEDIIKELEIELDFNLFDGQGLISPKQAKIWAEDLKLDYIPSCFIIRNAFVKGMLCTIDFHKFAKLNNINSITDIWGESININDFNIILTASQFKLWNSYSNLADYEKNCIMNRIFYGISRYSPKCDNKYSFSNYQFLQALELNDKQIEQLCQQTIDYFRSVSNNDLNYSLLYLLGKSAIQFDSEIYDKINDNVLKALILNNELINDPYIQIHVLHSLNKKIRESYIGNLLFNANYQFMINDPYAFMEHAFNLPVKGLLKRNEHFSNYWLKESVNQIVAMRAPLTWQSEVNILNLKTNQLTNEWYKYINSGIIYNIHGIDHMLHGGSDVDGDLVFTSNNETLIDGCQHGNPIAYETRKVDKCIITEGRLYEADLKSFNTKIGFITNCSTTMYAMLPLYEKNSREYLEIIKRLKQCRKEQGAQIDKSKGLIVKDFPKCWTNWTKTTEIMDNDCRLLAEFNNKLLIDKRPYFMRYLYGNYNKKYIKFCSNYDTYCISNFGFGINKLLEKFKKIKLLENKCL